MGSRAWIKIWCRNWLEGTLREEPPDIRGVWADLLALAGDGHYGDSGVIKASDNLGFTDGQITDLLKIDPELWQRAKERLQDTDRIKITEKGIITITNWQKYQPEYSRQKPYRQHQKATTIDPDKYVKGSLGRLVRR
jgi:hypothetical protein